MDTKKPLERKAYGSIGHLPISKIGQGDKRVHFGQALICLEKFRDKHDELVVQEKLDGSCVAVAKHKGELVFMTRAGYAAHTSPHRQHHLFAQWAQANRERFFKMLNEGERAVGEWLAQAHGTRYNLTHEPFVLFDLITGTTRTSFDEFQRRAENFIQPRLIHRGGPLGLHHVAEAITTSGHGAELTEGVVYRIYRQGKIDFLAKFVRPDFPTGKYLFGVTGHEDVWNWNPSIQKEAICR